jgi:hypothetical protein
VCILVKHFCQACCKYSKYTGNREDIMAFYYGWYPTTTTQNFYWLLVQLQYISKTHNNRLKNLEMVPMSPQQHCRSVLRLSKPHLILQMPKQGCGPSLQPHESATCLTASLLTPEFIQRSSWFSLNPCGTTKWALGPL